MKKIAHRIALVIAGVAVIFFATTWASAQRGTRAGKADVLCDYPGDFTAARRPGRRAFNFTSPFEVEEVVDRIFMIEGLTRDNLVLEATVSEDVPNAKAQIVDSGKRYIFYNVKFIREIREKAGTDWAVIFVLAHEIGHHLLGHSVEDPEGTDPEAEKKIRHLHELAADRFAGSILRRMRASLEQTEAAVNAMDDVVDPNTHPPKESRLKAIREGWNQAGEQESEPAARNPQEEARPALPIVRSAQRAFQLTANNTSRRVAQDWWTWNVFIDAPPEVLDQISCVVYQLHPTFNPNVYQVCEQGTGPAFALKGQGWGVFRIKITVLMKDNKQYELFHDLSFR